MSVITFVCAGQMNSAIIFPAFENGHEVSLDDYPLLMHVDEIINQGAEVNIPWEKFTMFVES